MRTSVSSSKIDVIDIVLVIYTFLAIFADEGAVSMQIARVILFGTFSLELIRQKKLKINIYFLWLGLFVIFSCASIYWAVDKQFSLRMSRTLLINFLCMLAIYNLVRSKPSRLNTIIKALSIAPIALGVKVVAVSGVTAYLTARSAGGVSGNTLGMCCAIGSCLAYFDLKKNGHHKLMDILLIFINIFFVIISSSRKAIICLIVPLVVLYLFENKAQFVKIIPKVFILIVLLIMAYFAMIKIPVLYQSVGHRIQSMFLTLTGTGQGDASSITRLNLTIWGIEWFKKKKVLGYGLDNFRIVLHIYHSDYPLSYYAHNNYVELLVDGGICGIFLYYWFYIYIIIYSLKEKKLTVQTIEGCGLLISIAISEIGLVSYYDKYIQLLLLIVWMTVRYQTVAYNQKYNR